MGDGSVFGRHFADIRGILAIFANNPEWPSPSNLFVIPDDTGFCIIDVGCGGPSGPAHLLGGLAHWGLDLRGLHTVVLTHSHPDHIGAIEWILREVNPRILVHSLDVPFALDPSNLATSFDIPFAHQCWDGHENSGAFEHFDLLGFFEQQGCAMGRAEEVEAISEGDVLRLGSCAFEVAHTPGHSPGHISLFERSKGVLLAGDVVGRTPTWYTPTSGGVIGYLDGLRKIEALEAEIILPSHGRVIEDPVNALATIRDRLLDRDAVIRESLIDGPKSFLELNGVLFPGPFARFFPGCGITESHLIKLEMEGLIRRERDKIVLVHAGN